MNKNCILAAAILALMMAAATGCGSDQAAEDSKAAPLQSEQPAETGTEDTLQQSQNDDVHQNDETMKAGMENKEKESPELIFIGGIVRSVSQDSFVISRTLLEESADGQGAIVVMPEAGNPEEELVTVRCMDSTVFERWTIKSGGEDIVQEDAGLSEIQEGTGLEAQGYFDGEEFIAEKVIIEIYE